MIIESGHTDVASMKNKVQIAMSALQKMHGELSKLGDEDDFLHGGQTKLQRSD